MKEELLKPARRSAREQIARLADAGSFREINAVLPSVDPLHFPEYRQKLNAAQERSGELEGVLTGRAAVQQCPCMLIVMEPAFLMGTMGSVVGEKIVRAFEAAARRRYPVVSLAASGGARMQEGVYALMQMAKTTAAVYRHGRRGLLYISVISDPTLGGVSASFASLGDVVLALKGARYGFTGRRLVEETTHEQLPEDFQTADYCLWHGQVDMVVEEERLRDTVGRLLRLHQRKRRFGCL